MDNKIVKLYAAYRSGCLGDNIFHVYYPFMANIISEEKWDIEVNETQVAKKFEDKYYISLPHNFVRQVLSIGIERKEIIYEQGRYVAQKEKLRSYSIDNKDFDLCWKKMMDGFHLYCKDKNVDLMGIDVESSILYFLDAYDEAILSNDELNVIGENDTFNYVWNSYLKYLSLHDSHLFNYVAAISFSNIQKETIFYSSDSSDSPNTYNGLNVYLDSPMVFALFGMDSDARVNSCKMLVSGMKKAGCSVHVFDHNFNEIKGILERAAGWATSIDYSVQKANNVARFFHDVLTEAPIIAEFCASTEEKLNELGITIKTTSYDVSKNDFQEDEEALYAMIEKKYTQDGKTILDEKKQSIMIDVRSIIMAYRERLGRISTKIQTCGHIMITLNGTLANVSKNFESNKSINSGHVPACISADLFGSVLWLFSPTEKMEYQCKQLLADCYVALRPSKEMMAKYIDSLNLARNADEIDEKKFLFMRAHVAVNDALMNVTKGDYARFNDQTYREVYDEIVAVADKKYVDEASAHMHTKERLNEVKRENDELRAHKEASFNRTCKFWGWVITVIVIGVPYIIVITIIEITKSAYSTLSFSSLIYVGLLVVVTIIAGILFTKGKEFCFTKVRKKLSVKSANK